MKTISRLAATAAMAVAAIAPSFAQTTLGAACGCPPVGSRPVVSISTLGHTPIGGLNESVLTSSNTVLTCDKIWLLDRRYYVDTLKTITIEPGTLIKGKKYSTPDSASALIVERGAKIIAAGTPDCQIVFTGINDPMNGTYGVSHRGDWGGLVIMGRAKNNLTLAGNGPAGPGKQAISDGVGYCEGWASANPRNHYGNPPGLTDDNDNSGILKYVSVRHAGAIISTGNELNGITLGSVGRGTTIENIEVISSDDDGIEFFGGTVNVKYVSAMFGADDMFDWDQGFSGKIQFAFGLAPDSTTSNTADNGIEADTWDNSQTGATPDSDPTIYNMTLIGNYSTNLASDNSGHAAWHAKDGTEGEVYNSIFSNWAYGFDTRTGTSQAYGNWTGDLLKLKCTAFNNIRRTAMGGYPLAHNRVLTGIIGSDTTKFASDFNTKSSTIAGFDPIWAMNTSNNTVSNLYDAVPNPALTTSGCPTPVDGFFTPASYKGAFSTTGKNWLSDYSYASMLGLTTGLVPCPTDINGDGITNNVDFLQLLGQFNQSCH